MFGAIMSCIHTILFNSIYFSWRHVSLFSIPLNNQRLHLFISNFISIFHNHIAINLEDVDETYANKD